MNDYFKGYSDDLCGFTNAAGPSASDSLFFHPRW